MLGFTDVYKKPYKAPNTKVKKTKLKDLENMLLTFIHQADVIPIASDIFLYHQ